MLQQPTHLAPTANASSASAFCSQCIQRPSCEHLLRSSRAPQGNIWDRYSDSMSTTSAEEGGKGGAKGRPQYDGPYGLNPEVRQGHGSHHPTRRDPANRDRSEWTQWQEKSRPKRRNKVRLVSPHCLVHQRSAAADSSSVMEVLGAVRWLGISKFVLRQPKS